MTLAENDQESFLSEMTTEKKKFETNEELEIFHREHYSNEISLKTEIFTSMDKFTKVFKTKLKGYFFSHHLKVKSFKTYFFNEHHVRPFMKFWKKSRTRKNWKQIS